MSVVLAQLVVKASDTPAYKVLLFLLLLHLAIISVVCMIGILLLLYCYAACLVTTLLTRGLGSY